MHNFILSVMVLAKDTAPPFYKFLNPNLLSQRATYGRYIQPTITTQSADELINTPGADPKGGSR